MNTLSFRFGPSPESNDHEVRILIDGVDILERVERSSLGLDPVDFFAQSALVETGNLLIGRCGCGCLGCGDEAVHAVHDPGTVSWVSPHRWISGIMFERSEYLSALARGRADTSWETVERTAERLVSSLDFSVFERRGMKFEWASGRIDKTRMSLSFNRGGHQELLCVEWNHLNPAEAERAVRKFIQDEEGDL